jgi:hypothetical protein
MQEHRSQDTHIATTIITSMPRVTKKVYVYTVGVQGIT